jgi:hypothetical protein
MINYYITIFVYTCDPVEACDRSYAKLQQYTSEGHGGSIFARKLINGRVHIGILEEQAHELLPGLDIGDSARFSIALPVE